MNAIQQVPSQSIQQSSSSLAQWSPDQVKILKQQIAPNCSDNELELFGYVCQRTGLDPFLKQIYAISRNVWNNETKRKEPKMSIQTGIDGLFLIAHRTKEFAGCETFWCGPDGQWMDVWLPSEPPAAAKVLVWRKGCDRPFVAVAKFATYAQSYKDSKTSKVELASNWSSMADLMIAKCAKALALRMAFPADMSGLYISEEMEQADKQPKQPRQVVSPQSISTVFSNFQVAVQAELGALYNGKDPAVVKSEIRRFAAAMRKRAGSELDEWADDINEVETDAIASISATDIKEVE